MRACEDKDKFPRFLPPGAKVAFKTGSLDETRTAAGIIEWPRGPVALCVLSCENEDKRWVADNAGNRLCALSPAPSTTISIEPTPLPKNSGGDEVRAADGDSEAEPGGLSQHLRQGLRFPVAVDTGQRRVALGQKKAVSQDLITGARS